eukprot:CAMPEP_0178423724 /NCGR_PEP_ID=MMETSP0689_2-20121128/27834_1 /TAXON_ID=160604 /ORGANISM="Amphidinium massartii, Strain CS-259" /LENGTH=476 /DNA_ID=CAMNT_0020045323 /DNA_START=12 /DNA_END=1442 /DNA_ORIENTATION=+
MDSLAFQAAATVNARMEAFAGMRNLSDVPVTHPWEATWWVKAFAKLGPDFPLPNAPTSEWESFVQQCSYVPVGFMMLGLVATLAILFCPCFRTCCAHCSFRDERGPPRRPSPTNPLCVGFFTLVLLGFGMVAYLQTGAQATLTARHQIGYLVEDLRGLTDASSQLNATAEALRTNLESLPPLCSAVARDQVQNAVDQTVDSLSKYQVDVAEYAEYSSIVLHDVDEVHKYFHWFGAAVGFFASLPLIWVVICCILEGLAVCCAQTGRCTRLFLCVMTPCIFAPTVLVVALTSAAQMWTGVTVSSFCKDVDSNTLAWVQHATGENSTVYAFTEYYLTDNGTNPIIAELEEAHEQLEAVNSSAASLEGLAALYCPSWSGNPELVADLNKASDLIQGAEDMIGYSRVHQYYNVAVRRDACGTVIIGLGWLVLAQVIVGLCMLPLLTCASDEYLHKRARWHARTPLLPTAQVTSQVQNTDA